MKFRNKSPESHHSHDYDVVPGTTVLNEQGPTTWDNIGQITQFQEQQLPSTQEIAETKPTKEEQITKQKNKLRYALLTGEFPSSNVYDGKQPLDQEALNQVDKNISNQSYGDNYISGILQQIRTPVHSKDPNEVYRLNQNINSNPFTALILDKASNSGPYAQENRRPDLLSAINNFPTPIEFRKFADDLERTIEKPESSFEQNAFAGQLRTAFESYEKMIYGKRKEYYDAYTDLYVDVRTQESKASSLSKNNYSREELREFANIRFDPTKRAPGQAVVLNSNNIDRETYHTPASRQPLESSYSTNNNQPQSPKKRGIFGHFRKSK